MLLIYNRFYCKQPENTSIKLFDKDRLIFLTTEHYSGTLKAKIIQNSQGRTEPNARLLVLDPVYTVPDLHGHDIILDSL